MLNSIKTVILAGGFGTRLSEETEVRPKPMVEIGCRPILWHIMQHYARQGFREFVLALGYKGEQVKHYFLDYHSLSNDMVIDLATGRTTVGPRQQEDWLVHLVDTGQHTNTGGRVRRLEPILSQETFMVTYGDGVSNVDLQALLSFHRTHGRLATVTAVRPPARFGSLVFDGDRVKEFTEKPQTGEGWINGGYMVLEPGVFRYLDGDASSLEAHAMVRLAADGELVAYRHDGFWQCMDTKRDLDLLRRLWDGGSPPWVVTP